MLETLQEVCDKLGHKDISSTVKYLQNDETERELIDNQINKEMDNLYNNKNKPLEVLKRKQIRRWSKRAGFT